MQKFRLPLIFAGLIVIYMVGLWASSLLPAEPVRRHIAESLPYLAESHEDPFYGYYEPVFDHYGKRNKATLVCYGTDAIMLNLVWNIDPAHPLRSPLESRMTIAATPADTLLPIADLEAALRGEPTQIGSYERYWHGYSVILRPLLEVFNYLDIRRINLFLLPLLGALVMILLARRSGTFAAVAFALSMVAVNFWVVPLCLLYQPVFYIALGACLLLLWRPETNAATVLFVAGSLTSFTDLLTTPLLTLGLPLAVLLLLRQEEWAQGKLWGSIKRIFGLCLIWAAGYVGTWFVKGFIAGMVMEDGFQAFLHQIVYRLIDSSGGSSGIQRGFFEMHVLAIGYNVLTLCTQYLWGIVLVLIAMVAGWFKWRRRGPVSKLVWLYLLIAAMPPGWYLVVSNHSFLHSFMTYRILAISVFCILLAYRQLIELPRCSKS